MNNILTAIKANIEHSSNSIVESTENTSHNGANQMGDALKFM
jgi:hypothetical protein